MFANQILLLAGAASVLVSSSPVPDFCNTSHGPIFCNSPHSIPDNTIGYLCNPPIVDASNTPLPFTRKTPNPDQKAVNRRIEKAMGRGECTYTDSFLKTNYKLYGPYLTSLYPPAEYDEYERAELAAQKTCFVSCIDAKDQPSIDWCNANGCQIVVSRVLHMSVYRHWIFHYHRALTSPLFTWVPMVSLDTEEQTWFIIPILAKIHTWPHTLQNSVPY